MTTPGPARPLRAVGIGIALWVGGRTAYLVNDVQPPPLVAAKGEAPAHRSLPQSAAEAAIHLPVIGTSPALVLPVKGPAAQEKRVQTPTLTTAGAVVSTLPDAHAAAEIFVDQPRAGNAVAKSASADPMPDIVAAPLINGRSKWSGSLWLAARDGASTGLASGGSQLGGSQAGFRLYRQLTPALSLTGRVSSALGTRQGEASAGIALRRGAFAVLAERRFALDSGGRNDWSVTAVAGVSDVKLPLGLRLDGYAQAGLVGRDGFADGALRVERTIMGEGPSRLSLGAGVWGSVQPGVARLDVGPQLVAHLTLAERPVRLAAEWRQRVAGNATPGSGPALTIGTDF